MEYFFFFFYPHEEIIYEITVDRWPSFPKNIIQGVKQVLQPPNIFPTTVFANLKFSHTTMEAIMWGRGAKGSFFILRTTNLRYIFEKVFEKKKYFEESFQKL